MIVSLPYGRGTIPVDLRGFRIRPLQPQGPRRSPRVGELALAALERPLSGRSLPEMAAAARNAVVVVPDGTRAAEVPAILPLLVDRLARVGIPPERQTVLIACGTHPPAPAADLADIVGPIPEAVAVVQHDARDDDRLVAIGTTPAGRTFHINRLAAEADLLVTIGAVRHHYFAGFGGGPKMIFPGVGAYDEIQANHAQVFDLASDPPRRREDCAPGVLEGNPVAEEIAAAADLRPPDMALCLVPGIDGGVSEACAGGWRDAFAAAVARVREIFEVAAQAFDLVVASGGGAPSDATLIQAHKGLDAACAFAAPGAEILYLAEMTEGPGSEAMRPFLADPRPEAIFAALGERWVQYGHTTFRLVEKTARFRVCLLSAAAWEGLEGLGFERVASPEAVVGRWREEHHGATVGVLTGPPVYRRRP